METKPVFRAVRVQTTLPTHTAIPSEHAWHTCQIYRVILGLFRPSEIPPQPQAAGATRLSAAEVNLKSGVGHGGEGVTLPPPPACGRLPSQPRPQPSLPFNTQGRRQGAAMPRHPQVGPAFLTAALRRRFHPEATNPTRRRPP